MLNVRQNFILFTLKQQQQQQDWEDEEEINLIAIITQMCQEMVVV